MNSVRCRFWFFPVIFAFFDFLIVLVADTVFVIVLLDIFVMASRLLGVYFVHGLLSLLLRCEFSTDILSVSMLFRVVVLFFDHVACSVSVFRCGCCIYTGDC
jgi:hypothetical protein